MGMGFNSCLPHSIDEPATRLQVRSFRASVRKRIVKVETTLSMDLSQVADDSTAALFALAHSMGHACECVACSMRFSD